MTHVACFDRPPAAEWSDLVDELDRWGEAERVAGFWWRDDDAVTLTLQLEALLRLAGDLPLGLAVIPALAEARLADALRGNQHVAVLQHGWQHANRASGGKKSEYPEGRSAGDVAAELGAGRSRLEALFGERAAAILVPPWNRFASAFLPLLTENGIAGISAMAGPSGMALPSGLVAIDVHVDLVAWRENRGFIGEAAALGRLVHQLQASRHGAAEVQGPIGILTHHLIMDAPTAAFLERLIALIGSHAASRWASASECLQ